MEDDEKGFFEKLGDKILEDPDLTRWVVKVGVAVVGLWAVVVFVLPFR